MRAGPGLAVLANLPAPEGSKQQVAGNCIARTQTRQSQLRLASKVDRAMALPRNHRLDD